jgi:hypothetical protein
MRDEIIRNWRKLPNDELCSTYSSPNAVRKSRRVK